MTNDLNTSHRPQREAIYNRRAIRTRQTTSRTEIPFTYLEQTVKRYTVNDAVMAAKAILTHRKYPVSMCVSAVSGTDLKRPITLVELNEIQSKIVSDSLYHS